MATLVFVHAHPDDEASQTAGTMARAVRLGHRVVVVYGTNGDHGEVPDDLAPGERVAAYRRREAEASAAMIGTQRVEWLGYTDSGMTGWAQNAEEGAFAAADLDEAGGRLAAILDAERADVVIGYDWHGGYGHPDHIKVHQVVHRAAELAAVRPRLLEVTFNRDHMRRMFDAAQPAGQEGAWSPDSPMDDGNPMGTPEAEIHYQVDVRDLIDVKRAALACHRSQKSDVGTFLAMPAEVFREGFGSEYFVEPGRPAGMRTGWILDADPVSS